MAEVNSLVVTLTANRGNKFDENGECIGTHGRSIVFLPKGAKPDEQVRVVIMPLRDGAGNDRKDGRGRTMYRANPAPDTSGEKWKDLGVGQASRIKTMTDWRGQTREVGVAETRPLGKREGTPTTRPSLKMIWDADLATSMVEDSPTRVIPLEEERVDSAGQLAWARTGERTEALPVERFAVKSLTTASCDWHWKRLEPTYQAAASVIVQAAFRRPDAQWDAAHTETSTWAAMPAWWRAEQEQAYPVCTCGRRRVDTKGSQDGYPKCETCRLEEQCGRCGATGQVKQIETRLVCPTCEPMEHEEALINTHVTVEKRTGIVAQVVALLAATKVRELADGEAILSATADHLVEGYQRDQLVKEMMGFPYYYFTTEGIYGSRFSPTALEVLAHYDVAAGNGLVRLTAWLAGDEHKAADRYGDLSRQFYMVTQVRGEEATPTLGEHDLKNNLSVAIRLRGSEAQRQAALAGLAMLREKLGPSARRVLEIEGILQAEAQDYGAAVAKIAEVEALVVREAAGEIVVGFGGYFRTMGSTGNANYWVVRSDGSLRDPDDKVGRRRYEESEGEKRWEIVQEDELALSWSKPDTASSHEFRVAHRPTTLTDEQRATVARLEDEIAQSWAGRTGMSGTQTPGIGDGWNGELGFRQTLAGRLEDIRQACGRSRVLRCLPERIRFEEARSTGGVWISANEIRGQSRDYLNCARPFDIKIERDAAQVVEAIATPGGIVEILIIEPRRSEDHPSMRLRWRAMAAEIVTPQTRAQGPASVIEFDARAIELAKAAERLVGRARTLEVFRRESRAEYGRGRRQAEIMDGIPGLAEDYDNSWILRLSRARDLDSAMDHVIGWLERQPAPARTSASSKPMPPKPVVPAPKPADLSTPDMVAKLAALQGKFGKKR